MQTSEREPSLVALQEALYSSRNPTRRWLHRERLALIRREIDAACQRHPAGCALEVGPGAGPYIPTLCERFPSVVACDVEGQYLRHVRSRNPDRTNLTLIEDDIADSRLREESFDVVLCSEVIEHVRRPRALLAGIFRILRPGGTLILSTPQRHSTVEVLGRVAFRPGMIRLARAIYREPVLPPGHISLLTTKHLGELLHSTGFDPEKRQLLGLYIPGLAELGGQRALRWEQRLADRISGTRLEWLLWTQCWRVVKPQ